MKSILIISLALTSTTLIMLSSCRSTDTDSNLSGGTTSVDINLLGSQFVDESPEAEASVNSKSALTYNGVQRHYTILILHCTYCRIIFGTFAKACRNIYVRFGCCWYTFKKWKYVSGYSLSREWSVSHPSGLYCRY